MDVYPGSNTQLVAALSESAQFITERLGKAQVSMVLGSGLGNFWQRLSNCESVAYGEIPFMSATNVPGHRGRLYYGEAGGMKIYCWGGRLHLYEGYESYQAAILAQISALLGCHTMLLTNGAGGGMKGMKPGCAMIIKDHINLEGFNTLDSHYHSLYSPVNFSPEELYSPELCAIAKEVGEREQLLPIFEGTYFCCSGPTFETQYETRAYITLGGDCFGMSTIPETLAARSCGMRVLGMSLVTNLATCLLDEELTHEYVLAHSTKAADAIEQLFCKIFERIATLPAGPAFNPARITITPETFQKLHNRHRQVQFSVCQINAAVQWVKKVNKGYAAPQVAICCNAMSVGALEEKREVLMMDLPYFPGFSQAGRLGKVAFGSLSSQRVVVLMSPTEEGFDPFESLFLAKILKEMGIVHIHYRFPAVNLPSSEAIYLQDYYSLTSQCLPSHLFLSSQPSRFSALGTANVVAWPGPGLPSPAEREMGRRLGGDYVTIADMSVLNAAGQVGLAHSGSIAAKDSEVQLQTVVERVGTVRAGEAGEVPVTLQEGGLLPVQAADVEDLARSIGSVKLTVVVDSEVFSSLREVLNWHITKTVTFSDCPRILHLTSTQVLVIEGLPALLQGEDLWRYSIPMRVSNLLGTQPVLIITHVTGAGETHVGDIVVLQDHCSLVGVNPMTGHNEAAWGVRFPDMKDMYAPGLVEQARTVLRAEGVEARAVYGVHAGTARLRLGVASAAAAAAVGAEVFLRNGVYDAILSQHRMETDERRKVLLLGHVSSHASTALEVRSLSAAQYRAAAQIVAKLST